MFTGLITDVGAVVSRNGGQFTIATAYVLEEKDLGASICCDGVCLTATGFEATAHGTRFTDARVVDAGPVHQPRTLAAGGR